jgi:hypothetical protein
MLSFVLYRAHTVTSITPGDFNTGRGGGEIDSEKERKSETEEGRKGNMITKERR